MRTPRHRRTRRRAFFIPPDVDLDEIADTVAYVGSSEHKDYRSFAGPAKLRSDASCCPRDVTQEMATKWLRFAIRRGATGTPWEGNFPRYAWCKIEDTVFEARLVNRGNGSYKGYPLEIDEWPKGIDNIYA